MSSPSFAEALVNGPRMDFNGPRKDFNEPRDDSHEARKNFIREALEGSPERRKPRVAYVQQMVALLFVAGLFWLLFGKGSPLAGTGGANSGARNSETGRSGEVVSGAGNDATSTKPSIEIPRPWVASTSPAITDTLVDLGLIAHIVGRSPYCRSVPKEMPVVGDLRDFDAERLALARPDVLFVQPPLAGIDPALRDYCGAKGIRLIERRIDSFTETRALVAEIADVFGATPIQGADGIAGRLAQADA
ncbi:MAG: hypothetical protein ACKO3W_06835, partial [bacterium]